MMVTPIGRIRDADALPLATEICPGCGRSDAVGLPIPAAERSMLSDGRVIARPLDKLWCRGCGLIRHRQPPTPAEISAIYSGAYGLPALTGSGEQFRGRAYASAILEALGETTNGLRLLDVGCGSGAMLRALLERDEASSFRLTGIDPALPAALALVSERLTLKRGFPDSDLAGHDLAGHDLVGLDLVGLGPFDVVISINTIEHTPDPAKFLSTLETLMTPGGMAIVICPTTEFANDELLFFDHFWSISGRAMAGFAASAGLHLIGHAGLASPLAGFQLFRFMRSTSAEAAAGIENASADAIAYLTAWKELDASLEQLLLKADKPAQAFGAGQMAALLRAYAPRTFAVLKRFLLDHPEEAWPLGPAIRYDGLRTLDGWITLVAVHPSAQNAVAARIRGDGGIAVTLPATIQH
jgi:SAM-dependent methyltransferase